MLKMSARIPNVFSNQRNPILEAQGKVWNSNVFRSQIHHLFAAQGES